MAERIMLVNQSASTRKAYLKCAADYEQHRAKEPHSETVFLSFLVKESETKVASTLWTLFSHVKKYLLLECGLDIGSSQRIIDFLKSKSRMHKKKKAEAFTRDELFRYLREAPSDGNFLISKLILLAGFYGGLRGCELVALTWDDLTLSKEGFLLRIAFSKTDRAGVGAVKLLPVMEEKAICPVAYFTEYKALVPETKGRLFLQYRDGKFIRTPIGKNKIAEIPRTIALFLGLENPASYTGHALRVSSATTFADEGANSLALKRHGRWASDNVAEGYLRESKHVRLEAASLLSGSKLTL
jgi:integrase